MLKFSCLVILLAFYDYLERSPYIRLERVVVMGVDEDLKEELLEMAQLDFETSVLSTQMPAVFCVRCGSTYLDQRSRKPF